MTKKPFILITNDDGIASPGIKHLWQSLVGHADLAIVAPAYEQSCVGLKLTLRKPLHIESVEWDKSTPVWKVTGTPADCVRLAMSLLLPRQPDMIVSGINRGTNAGRNVLYSGTVAGVVEGIFRNIPGVAFSCEEYDKPDYKVVEKYIPPIVQHCLKDPLPRGTFLNVTFPERPGDYKGVKFARQGQGYWIENPDQRVHPEGKPYCWLGGKWQEHDEHEESDVHLLKQGYVTAVPLHVNELTDHAVYAKRRDSFDSLFPS